jgi:hypothetical protein
MCVAPVDGATTRRNAGWFFDIVESVIGRPAWRLMASGRRRSLGVAGCANPTPNFPDRNGFSTVHQFQLIFRRLHELMGELVLGRGAGKSHELPNDMMSCVRSYKEYGDAHGSFPDSYTVQQALDFDTAGEDRLPKEMSDRDWEEWEIASAERAICKAALGSRLANN